MKPDSGVPGEFSKVVDNGPGNLPGYQYRSGSHTNSLIPLYAKGAGSGLFGTCVAGTDVLWGEYIDNTAIANVVFTLLESWKSDSRKIQDQPVETGIDSH